MKDVSNRLTHQVSVHRRIKQHRQVGRSIRPEGVFTLNEMMALPLAAKGNSYSFFNFWKLGHVGVSSSKSALCTILAIEEAEHSM